MNRSVRVVAVAALAATVLMGQRRPACTGSSGPTPRLFAATSPSGTGVSLCERCTHDFVLSPQNASQVVTSIYAGDEDSLLFAWPFALLTPTSPPANYFAGTIFYAFGDLVPGTGGGFSSLMLPARPGATTSPTWLRQYDRGACSLFLPWSDLGPLMSLALDDTLSTVFLPVRTTGNNPVAILPAAGWTIRPAISINISSPLERRYESGSPAVSQSTFDRVRLTRTYTLSAPVEGQSQSVTATIDGRYVDAGGIVTFFATADFGVTGTGATPTLGGLLPGSASYITLITTTISAGVNARWAAYRAARAIPAGTRIQQYPTGLEEVIAEDSSTSAYATLASHPLRSNYCGASRVKPVLGSTSGTSFVAAGVMPVLITGTSP